MKELDMRLPVVATKTHLGKSLEVDCDRETLTLYSPAGEELGSLPWEYVINQVLIQAKPTEQKESRTHPRVSLSFHIRYITPEGNQYESVAGRIGAGGLFIESTAPLQSGTKISMEIMLPGDPSERVKAKGEIAWVCPKADQYTFSPGMGVRFTETPPETRKWIQSLLGLQSQGNSSPE